MLVYRLYTELLEAYHILIAGTTGSGKSTLLDGLMYAACNLNPAPALVLIDPKRTTFKKYKDMIITARYETDIKGALMALRQVADIMVDRYKELDEDPWAEKSTRPPIYVFIDEYADLICGEDNKKTTQEAERLIIKLARLGRAANIHLIIATQTVLANIVKTEIKSNFVTRIALHMEMPSQSRLVLGISGAENLPEIGRALIIKGGHIKEYVLPRTPRADLERVVNYWNK